MISWGIQENFRNLEIIPIPTGVAKAAGHKPRERNQICNYQTCKVELRGFQKTNEFFHPFQQASTSHTCPYPNYY
jgi:hypothetical protein